jgi:retron-type reverse transcriptase
MSILSEIASKKQLVRAWRKVAKKKKVTPGIDEEDVFSFEKNLSSNLDKISYELRNKTYSFNKVIASEIPKKDFSKKREIKLFTLRDKVVHKSLNISFEAKTRTRKPLFPELNNKVSIGFISNLSGVIVAVERIRKFYDTGYKVLVVADIKNFFDVISRSKIKAIIKKRLAGDHSIDWLLEKVLNPKVVKVDRYSRKETDYPDTGSGVAQGSILAPMLSNIYMINFDKEIEHSGLKVIRYADDIAILSKSLEQGKKDYETSEDLLLKHSGLKFHNPSSGKGARYYQLEDYGIFLGIKLKKKREGSWLIIPTPEKTKLFKCKLQLSIRENKHTIIELILKMNRSISSWFSTYKEIPCTRRELKKIYSSVEITYAAELNKLLLKLGIISKYLNSRKLKTIGILKSGKNF